MNKDTNYYKTLQELSREAEARRTQKINEARSEREAKFWATKRINWILLNEVYEVGEATEFKSCEDWNREGCTVKLDSKPFVIWGQKREDDKYYPLVFLFSDLQVLKPQDCREVEEAKETSQERTISTIDNIENDLI